SVTTFRGVGSGGLPPGEAECPPGQHRHADILPADRPAPYPKVSPMHSVDPTTEQMIRLVLAYAENRLRLDPVPLDGSRRDPAQFDAVLSELPSEEPHNADQVLGAYASVLAPAVISADSPRFLGFIPAAPTKAALLFDMLVSCASI